MNFFQRLLTCIVLLAILTACTGTTGPKPTPTAVPTPVMGQKPTYTVQRGDVSKVLELRGRVIPIQQQDLFFGIDGFVDEVYVRRGDTVKADDLLAKLEEPKDYNAEIAAAELALEQANNDLAAMDLDAPVKLAQAQLDMIKASTELTKTMTKRGSMDRPRVVDDLTLAQYRAAYASASQAYADAQESYGNYSGVPESDPERIAALNWLIDARRTYHAALANLNYVTGKSKPSDVALADAELAVAQSKYDRAVAEVERLSQEGGTFERKLALTKIADAGAKVESTKKEKEKIELRAPFDGQVISIAVSAGDSVAARKVVLTLADPESLEISIIPSPEELADMGVGQAATIRLTSQQGVDYPGKVRLLPDTSSSNSSGGGQKDSSARIVLNNSTIKLTMNEAVVVIISIETRSDVLWLPPAALRTFQGRDFVLVDESGVQRRLDVLIGLESPDRIEIVSGLEEGKW